PVNLCSRLVFLHREHRFTLDGETIMRRSPTRARTTRSAPPATRDAPTREAGRDVPTGAVWRDAAGAAPRQPQPGTAAVEPRPPVRASSATVMRRSLWASVSAALLSTVHHVHGARIYDTPDRYYAVAIAVACLALQTALLAVARGGHP